MTTEETLALSDNNHEKPVQSGDVTCATSESSLTSISAEGATLHPQSISTQSEQDGMQIPDTNSFYPQAEPPTSHGEGRGEAVKDNYTECKKFRNKQLVRFQTVEIF